MAVRQRAPRQADVAVEAAVQEADLITAAFRARGTMPL